MKSMNLKTLFAFITGICLGLTIGIAVSNRWSVSVSFGKDNIPVVSALQPVPSLTYFSQIVDSDGEVATWTNEPGPSPPDLFDGIPWPTPAPIGSENDPNYQAEIIDKGDGTMTLLPAPAYRN